MIFHQNVEYNFLLIENRSNFGINRITVFAFGKDANGMSIDWKEYEVLAFRECKRIFSHCEIQHNIYVDGLFSKRKRQIDIQVRDQQGQLIIIDSKKYNKKVDIKTVESFIGMVKDVGADKGIIISEKGFSKSAINRAHYGEDNVEVDILNLHELSMFQNETAIPYAGKYGVIAFAPFCWIIDGTRRNNMVASLYRRGYSFEEAALNKEWAYINFWDKDCEIGTLDELVAWQNADLLDADKDGIIQEICSDSIRIRVFKSKKYPCTEVTLYREFKRFILFAVLFSPDNMIDKNIEKMKFFLLKAFPLNVIQPN
ncbi:MAG: restriction endonuclease [Salinivirgaceae bacterium]|nr:restriction endonuclease [Salinivirgaceae bacterium]